MFLASIAHTETVERRARLIDMRNAMLADQNGFDEVVRKLDSAAERLAALMKEARRG